MWLLITAFAALVCTALWRMSRSGDRYKLGFLSLMYWGATLMWLVDHVLAYADAGGPFFEIDANATALGFSVLGLGLVVWLGRLLLGDSGRSLRGVVRR